MRRTSTMLAALAACGGARSDAPADPGPISNAEVADGDVDVDGGLTADQVQTTIRASSAALLSCYQRELERSPDLAGEVAIRFEVDDGVVVSAQVDSSTLDNPTVEACLVGVYQRMTFPAGDAIVVYPLRFHRR